MRAMATLAIVLLTITAQGTAFGAEQTKAQQKCINALNKGMAKVAGTQNKVYGKCVKNRSKDGTTDVVACATADAKVLAAQRQELRKGNEGLHRSSGVRQDVVRNREQPFRVRVQPISRTTFSARA